jgi:hypothetical protein
VCAHCACHPASAMRLLSARQLEHRRRRAALAAQPRLPTRSAAHHCIRVCGMCHCRLPRRPAGLTLSHEHDCHIQGDPGYSRSRGFISGTVSTHMSVSLRRWTAVSMGCCGRRREWPSAYACCICGCQIMGAGGVKWWTFWRDALYSYTRYCYAALGCCISPCDRQPHSVGQPLRTYQQNAAAAAVAAAELVPCTPILTWS